MRGKIHAGAERGKLRGTGSGEGTGAGGCADAGCGGWGWCVGLYLSGPRGGEKQKHSPATSTATSASALRLWGGNGVVAGQGIRADAEDVGEHAQAVAEGVEARAFAVRPDDRNFFDGETEAAGEEENFRIEAPALDALKREDALSSRAAEGFESTLRVGEIEAEKKAQGEIEDAPEELAVEGLALGLQVGAKPAGADGDVGAGGDGGEKFLRLGDRGGEIGVGEEADVAASVEHSVADAEAFAAVAGILDEKDLRVGLAVLADDFGGIVAGAVVDNEDFNVPVLQAGEVEKFVERGAEAGALVVGRDDDGNQRDRVIG